MSRLLIRGHLGLGDHLICNGLVRELVAQGEEVTIPCYPNNEPSVLAMFADLDCRVETIEPSCEDFARTLYLGGYAVEKGTDKFDRSRWDQEFYCQAGIPFHTRWTSFKIAEEAIPRPRKTPIECFIHDDVSRGFVIPNVDGYRPREASTIFRFLPELMAAQEVHCINSCFAILADSVGAPGKKFLHRYARPTGTDLPVFKEDWTILDAPL